MDTLKNLQSRLEELENFQKSMTAINDYCLTHQTLEGCTYLSAGELERLQADMAQNRETQPYPNYVLANNLNAIGFVKIRIEDLTRPLEAIHVNWELLCGGFASTTPDGTQLQVSFDHKPDQKVCAELQNGGFCWDAAAGVWQRPFDAGAVRTVDHMICLRPLFGFTGSPSELYQNEIRKQRNEKRTVPAEKWKAVQYQMSKEERLIVQFCDLIRYRFPALAENETAAEQTERVTELAKMFSEDSESAAKQMLLTVSGFVIGTEVEPGIHERAGRLMQNLSIYQKPIKAYSLKTSDKKGPQSSRNKRTRER